MRSPCWLPSLSTCSPLHSRFVRHCSGVIDGPVEIVSIKVCGPWMDSSAWISVAWSKRWELDGWEQEGGVSTFPPVRFHSAGLSLIIWPGSSSLSDLIILFQRSCPASDPTTSHRNLLHEEFYFAKNLSFPGSAFLPALPSLNRPPALF